MPSFVVVAPIALPLVAAAAVAGLRLGRMAAAAGAWASAVALLAVWLPVRSSLELLLGGLGYGSSLDLRVDAVSFAFGLMVALPVAALLTMQPRSWQESALSLVGLAAAMATVEAGGVVLTAIAGSTAASIALVYLITEDPRAPRPTWGVLLAGWLALAWVGVILQVGGGTAVYSAVPVATVTGPVFVVLAAAAVLASSLVPWRGWPTQLWTRPSLRAAGITVATLYPLGFYILVRAYELGVGRYPNVAFNVILALTGIAVAVSAAVRAQAVATRREFFAEVVPASGGFALCAIALGTPLSLVAGIVMLATGAALVVCISLLPDRTGIASLVAVAAGIGLPPGIAFASRVLGVESAFEAGDFMGLLGLAAAAAWALWVLAGARAIGLPGGRGHPATETFPRAAMAVAAGTIVAGPAVAVFAVGFANPAAAEVMQSEAGSLAGGAVNVVTVSSVLPAVTLLTPLLVIALLVYAGTGMSAIRTQARPAIVPLGATGWLQRARVLVTSITVPEQYRTLLSADQLEAAVAGSRPALWLMALVALGFAVTR